MTDQELADAVVALGALHQRDRKRWPDLYIVQNYGDEPLRADEAVRDWRVAGAFMEKVERLWYRHGKLGWEAVVCKDNGDLISDGINESLPRAIIEACVNALKVAQ